MKDKNFYGGGEHPEAGAELVYINGQWHDTYDIYHPKCKSQYSEKVKNETQKKLENNTVNHTGFSKPKVVNNNEKTERQQQLDRLQLMKCQEARLIKQLNNTRSVIQHIEKYLCN